jgi:hypothetical protein
VSRKRTFIIVVAGLSALLFAVWPQLSALFCLVVSGLGSGLRTLAGLDSIELMREKDSYLLIPVLAVIGASLGHGWRRKAVFALVGLGAFVALGTLSVTFDLVSASVQSSVARVFFNLLGIVLPVGVLVGFLGGRPWLLWERPKPKRANTRKCPVCGQAVEEISSHVRRAHGKRAMSLPAVRRAINKSGNSLRRH